MMSFDCDSAVPDQVRRLDALFKRARDAQECLCRVPEQQIEEGVLAAGWAIHKNAAQLCTISVQETRFGNVTDSLVRLRQRTQGLLQDLAEAKTTGVVEEDRANCIQKIAKPVGVIVAATPSTAPTAAIAMHALCALKTRNSMVVCPNPSTASTASATTEMLRDAVRKVGLPADVFQNLAEPNRELAGEAMARADLIVASGGEGTVKRAYSSGRPAYGAGTGNASVIIDETADLDRASALVISGASFDNGTSCSSESNLIVAETVYEKLVTLLKRDGGHICDGPGARRLARVMWPDRRSISRNVVGRTAREIAGLAGIAVADDVKVLFAEGQMPVAVDPFYREKLCPVVALWKYSGDIDEAISILEDLTRERGKGHSCGIFSNDPASIQKLALGVRLSRVMVNQSTSFGNSGSFGNGLPFSAIVSCGTWGGSSVSENITWRHFLNYTYVSYVKSDRSQSLDQIFNRYWIKYGK
jgi:sulfoacetaldehyde dehydrogenase